MTSLDDVESLDGLDSLGVLDTAESLASQCRTGWDIGTSAGDLPDPVGVESLAVLGMGGSGIAGGVTGAVVSPRLPIPHRVMHDYGPLPPWVGRNSIVIAVSYSGNTEETVSALDDAIERGARIITVSSGGALAEQAREHGLAWLEIPGGFLPRACVGYMTMAVMGALQAMGLIPSMDTDVRETLTMLDELSRACDRRVPKASNPSKALAARLAGRIPVVYGGAGLGAVAAERFKCDLNEYAKVPAFYNELPEMDHNEVMGWSRWADRSEPRFCAVFLSDPGDHPRVNDRVEVTRELLAGRLDSIVLRAKGESRLARIFSLIFVTQLTAIYMGLGAGVDPGPIDMLEDLKKMMAKR